MIEVVRDEAGVLGREVGEDAGLEAGVDVGLGGAQAVGVGELVVEDALPVLLIGLHPERRHQS